ncbi:hypothetical protein PFNF135_03556 [Plasmodium falciparum NF135/5.C10]|uniref:Gamma-butyrobetaine hydroxylase-like N-terminal domain-containing protein n=1 Tax=Plasmodium falciparum NF135/5.C10 TaxID=1036726 RepID=W4IEE3_PLAFA|nr:hypothetical protein PFNF135_03556 [Plasmodium falciparum NF135/5.C10]
MSRNNKNKIENIILIYSCKGGVGKSFFSVNFSYYLKKKGASVGILDADINGPSLPTLLPFDYEYVKFKVVNKKKDEPTKGKNGYIYNDDMNNNNNDDVDNNDMNNNIDNNNIDNNNIHNNNIHNNNLHNNNLHNNLHNNLQNSDGKNTFCGEKKKKNSFTHEKYFITQYDNEPKDDDDDFFFNLSLEKRKEKKKKKKPNRENLLNIFNSKNYNKLSNDDKKNSGTIEYDENLSMIEPLIYNDVKLMSYAYIKNKMNLGFSSFRGPILNELIKEFLYHVNWGILDYLIIDMPPGTNDIHLNLFESEKIDGIIMITTPNDLSTNDVEKGINMCNFFNIPIVCLVINMNYFICDNCDKKHYIFNNTDMKSLKDKIRNIYEIPFHPILAKNVYTHKHNYKKDTTNVLSIQDANIKHNEYTQQKMEHISEEHIKHFPFILAYDKNHFLIEHLENLFQQIVREIAILKYNHNLNIPNLQIYKKNYLQLSFDTIQNKYVFSDDVLICHIKDIRRKCKCLICKENKKEKKCIQYDKNNNHNNYNFKKKISLFPPNIYVKDIIPLGIYNVKIVWSDNHSSIYSYVYLKHLFEKKRINNNNLFCKTNNSGMYEW